MRKRHNPWKWPVCIGLTFGLLLAAVFLVPASWIEAFFSPLSIAERLEREQETAWLAILPPPQVEMVADWEPEPSPPDPAPELPVLHQDPDWWSRGWVITATPREEAAQVNQAAADSVAILLAALGVERDFMSRARPDSVLAAKLFILQVEDSFRFDELKPYLTAMARFEDYTDIMSRAADMYDDFLGSQIMTPD